jgi:hypothetical protein
VAKFQQFSDPFFQPNKKLKFSLKISPKEIGNFETLNKSVKTNTKPTKKPEGTGPFMVRTSVLLRMNTGSKRRDMSSLLI